PDRSPDTPTVAPRPLDRRPSETGPVGPRTFGGRPSRGDRTFGVPSTDPPATGGLPRTPADATGGLPRTPADRLRRGAIRPLRPTTPPPPSTVAGPPRPRPAPEEAPGP